MTVALSLKGGRSFALGLWLRAAAIGALAFAAIEAAVHRRYATVAVILGVAAVVGLDLARSAQATDRMLAQFIDILMMEGDERPLATAGAGRLAASIGRALDRLSGARAQRQQRLDFAEALADNVVAALLVVDEAGLIVRANRAARLMLGETAGPLYGCRRWPGRPPPRSRTWRPGGGGSCAWPTAARCWPRSAGSPRQAARRCAWSRCRACPATSIWWC